MSTRHTESASVDGSDEGVLLATGESRASAMARRVGAAVASVRGATLHVVSPVTLPHYTPLDVPDWLLEESREAVRETVDRVGVETAGAVRVGHDRTATLAGAATERDVDTLVLDQSLADDGWTRPTTLDALSARTRCDAVAASGGLDGRDAVRVLVPVARGPHSGLAVETGHALAAATDGRVDLLHVVSADTPDERADAEALLDSHARRFDGERVRTRILDSADVAGTIREQSRDYDVTVIGAPRSGRLRRLLGRSTATALESELRSPVAVVRRARASTETVSVRTES